MSPRKILTEEERAERKRNAWNPNQFKKGKPGNEQQWKEGAQALAGLDVDGNLLAYSQVLGLTSVPKTLKELRSAYLATMKKYHPDKLAQDPELFKSANEISKNINAANDEIKKHLEANQ